MTIDYEWTIEEMDTSIIGPDADDRDIVDSNFSDTLAGFSSRAWDAIDGTQFKLALVRDHWRPYGGLERSWAYCIHNGTEWELPDHFVDAFGRFEANINKPHHAELARRQK